MSEETNWLEWAFKGGVSGACMAIYYAILHLYKKMSQAQESQQTNEKELLSYKLEAEKTYVKHTDLQQILARIDHKMDEMVHDIKTLIARR